MQTSILITLFLLSISFVCEAIITLPGYDLPVLPSNVSPDYDPSKTVPLDVYMTMRDPSHLDDDFLPFIKNNDDCKFHLNNDEGMDKFMNTEFANTSIQWVFNNINPKLMASKADVWRMAVLWMFGGIYMDADSFVSTKLSQIIQPTDRFIFGAENNAFHDCYAPPFHLNNTNTSSFAEGKQIVNWLLVASPRHPFVTQTLHNLVWLSKRQYFEEKYLYEIEREPFFKIICTTGPGALTASMSQVIYNSTGIPSIVLKSMDASIDYISTNSDNKERKFSQYRYVGVDWKQYGGQFKTWGNWKTNKLYSDKPHYFEVMKKGGKLLEKYARDVVYFP